MRHTLDTPTALADSLQIIVDRLRAFPDRDNPISDFYPYLSLQVPAHRDSDPAEQRTATVDTLMDALVPGTPVRAPDQGSAETHYGTPFGVFVEDVEITVFTPIASSELLRLRARVTELEAELRRLTEGGQS